MLTDASEPDRVSRALREIVWQFGPKGLDGQCCQDLSMPEYLALETAAMTTDCPVQDIGARLGFTKSGATRIVNRLEKKGYIQKCRSSEDGRICCVMPTEKGRQILANESRIYMEKLEAVLEKTPEGKSDNIRTAIVSMAEVLRR
jgi:DNA-binding MarR family transcriptional regulator